MCNKLKLLILKNQNQKIKEPTMIWYLKKELPVDLNQNNLGKKILKLDTKNNNESDPNLSKLIKTNQIDQIFRDSKKKARSPGGTIPIFGTQSNPNIESNKIIRSDNKIRLQFTRNQNIIQNKNADNKKKWYFWRWIYIKIRIIRSIS